MAGIWKPVDVGLSDDECCKRFVSTSPGLILYSKETDNTGPRLQQMSKVIWQEAASPLMPIFLTAYIVVLDAQRWKPVHLNKGEDAGVVLNSVIYTVSIHARTHTQRFTRWAGTRKVKPIWILLKQETVSGSDIIWTLCKSAPSYRQIAMPAPYHSVFYRPDAIPAIQPIWPSGPADAMPLAVSCFSKSRLVLPF